MTHMMRRNATIQKYSLSTTEQYADITGGGKVFLFVDGDDVRIALDQPSISSNYFLILDGTTLILDYPLGIDAPIWVRQNSDSATGVTMRVMITANPYMEPTPVEVIG